MSPEMMAVVTAVLAAAVAKKNEMAEAKSKAGAQLVEEEELEVKVAPMADKPTVGIVCSPRLGDQYPQVYTRSMRALASSFTPNALVYYIAKEDTPNKSKFSQEYMKALKDMQARGRIATLFLFGDATDEGRSFGCDGMRNLLVSELGKLIRDNLPNVALTVISGCYAKQVAKKLHAQLPLTSTIGLGDQYLYHITAQELVVDKQKYINLSKKAERDERVITKEEIDAEGGVHPEDGCFYESEEGKLLLASVAGILNMTISDRQGPDIRDYPLAALGGLHLPSSSSSKENLEDIQEGGVMCGGAFGVHCNLGTFDVPKITAENFEFREHVNFTMKVYNLFWDNRIVSNCKKARAAMHEHKVSQTPPPPPAGRGTRSSKPNTHEQWLGELKCVNTIDNFLVVFCISDMVGDLSWKHLLGQEVEHQKQREREWSPQHFIWNQVDDAELLGSATAAGKADQSRKLGFEKCWPLDGPLGETTSFPSSFLPGADPIFPPPPQASD
jgi:hypothetical protein